eukprot:CAMPEP_0184858250 /NCGR_PEP_ID=MMETSP0580-20130426/3387_1 /TAXON_ID=1118495 /ORGANISM="Dactyliosolen fragilissimus" /LENGTH=443 /DNA_ID=CAMNT_0027354323 /DNA_START=284 /DNA_END=1615 /DNA_ORIENTATION=+
MNNIGGVGGTENIASNTGVAGTHTTIKERWERSKNIRSIFGEEVARPSLDTLRSTIATRLQSGTMETHDAKTIQEKLKTQYVDIWRKLDCFDSPTLLDELNGVVVGILKDILNFESKTPQATTDHEQEMNIRNNDDEITSHEGGHIQAAERSSPTDSSDVSEKITTPTPSDVEDNMDLFENDDRNNIGTNVDNTDDVTTKEQSKVNSAEIQSKSKDEKQEKKSPSTSKERNGGNFKKNLHQCDRDFDFEAEGIPLGNVQISELQLPCKSISSMQINRDLRSDTATQLSAIISTIPQEVINGCEASDKDEENDTPQFDQKMMESIPDEFLDLDLDKAIADVKIYRDIIAKQMEARHKCLELLIKSRCKFKAQETAELYYSLESKIEHLKGKKRKIFDAMELEGLDFEGLEEDNGDVDNDEIESLPWFTQEDFLLDREKKALQSA